MSYFWKKFLLYMALNNSYADDLLNRVFNNEDKGTRPKINLGESLNAKLEEYGLSKTRVITLLGIDKATFDDIISGNAKQPTLINVIKIAEFLELDHNDVIEAIISSQSAENIGSIEKARNATFVAKNFDIKRLAKADFFTHTDDPGYLINRILSFFGYDSIGEYEHDLNSVLFSRTKRQFIDKMKDFWVKSAYQCFKKINNQNEYDRDALKELVPKIKPYCRDENNGLFTVCKALYNAGVTVIFQKQLTTTQVRGGTFVVNNKPCIVLTDLNKSYTTIWETLVHELYHVLFDLDKISKQFYHISGEDDLLLIEDKAEKFSREFFCGYDEYKYIAPHIGNRVVVNRYAKKLEIHPSFIYSSFKYFQDKLEGNNYWAAFKGEYPDHNKSVSKLKPVTWKEKSIEEIAGNIQKAFQLTKTTQ